MGSIKRQYQMDTTIVRFRLFILFSPSPSRNILLSQAQSLSDVDLYIFEDILQALAHIHLCPDLLVADAANFDAVFLLEQTKENSPMTKTILIGQPLPTRKIVLLMKKGAADYIETSELTENMLQSELTEFNTKILSNNSKNAKITIVEKFKAFGFVGNSRSMQNLYRLMENAGRSSGHICIVGESGSGKELVAKTIQQLSKNKEAPLYFFDIYAIPEALLEIELFGQEKNVFSGILKRHIGIIEQASGGILIIDNVDIMPLPLQGRLQRALQEKKFLRPGGQNIVFFNARILAMSQKNLLNAVEKGQFRKDLYYQLSTILIEVPPLRKRGQDILILASHILRDFIRKNKLKTLIFTQSAKDILLSHSFPGNVRELKAIVESSAMMASPPEISKDDLIFHETIAINTWLGEELTLQAFTDNIILYYLDKYDNDVLLVADKLNIGKSTIYRLLKKQPYDK